MQNLTNWEEFSDTLQNLHDSVHVWVGGSMSDPAVASYDPIFHAHHCMIDRLWYLWQVKHGNGGIPEELLDLSLDPFPFTFRQVLNVQALGYEYAVTAAAIPGN
ncbi:MAG: tyrosinase family protein [Pseudomonadota bacterium]